MRKEENAMEKNRTKIKKKTGRRKNYEVGKSVALLVATRQRQTRRNEWLRLVGCRPGIVKGLR